MAICWNTCESDATHVKIFSMSNKAIGADNQQATLIYKSEESSETIRQAPFLKRVFLAYLNGAIHDATLNKGKRVRFAQKEVLWLEKLKRLLTFCGYNSWIYKEGKNRNVYVLETLCKELSFNVNPTLLVTPEEKAAYLRGFFDAEGGIPRKRGRFYIQLVQKNYEKIAAIKKTLLDLGIASGRIHNPSKRVDPDYWRIFIPVSHHKLFAGRISSWHPIKAKIFKERMKI